MLTLSFLITAYFLFDPSLEKKKPNNFNNIKGYKADNLENIQAGSSKFPNFHYFSVSKKLLLPQGDINV